MVIGPGRHEHQRHFHFVVDLATSSGRGRSDNLLPLALVQLLGRHAAHDGECRTLVSNNIIMVRSLE